MKKRELYADFLRFISIFFVVVIHSTVGYLVNNFPNNGTKFLLVISSITSCAVPIFYMLSGTFLISKENQSFSRMFKRVKKIFFQLMFWNLIYFLIYKFILKQDINILLMLAKSIFSSQVSHLWFMYPLLGLYVLLPIISTVYYSLDKKEKKYSFIIFFIIPILLSTIDFFIPGIISIPYFSIGFPELGLFVLGKYLYENKEKFYKSKWTICSIISWLLGLMLILIFAYFYLQNNSISSRPYFDYNKIPNLMLTISTYIFFLSLNKKIIKLPKWSKKAITFIGNNSGGVYYVHMIFLNIWPSIKIFKWYFTCNQGSIINILLGAFLYFILSLLLVFILKKVPILKRAIE